MEGIHACLPPAVPVPSFFCFHQLRSLGTPTLLGCNSVAKTACVMHVALGVLAVADGKVNKWLASSMEEPKALEGGYMQEILVQKVRTMPRQGPFPAVLNRGKGRSQWPEVLVGPLERWIYIQN